MSRHRNVRGLNYDDEYDGYYDVYGHSVDDECALSPSSVEREFTFDRSARQHNMDAFLHCDRTIAEETEEGRAPAGRQDSVGSLVPAHMGEEDRVRLLSCLDAVRNVVGETVSDHAISRAVLRHDFDCQRALDAILSDAVAGMPGSGGSRVSRRDSSESQRSDDSTERSAAIGRSGRPQPTAAAVPPPPAPQPVRVLATPSPRQPATQPARVVRGFQEQRSAEKPALAPPAEPVSVERAAAPAEREAAALPAEVQELRVAKSRSSSSSPRSSRQQSPSQPAADSVTHPARTRTRDAQAQYDQERAGGKQLINMVVIGHVDAGKSTLMGHLLYQLGCVNKKVMHKYETESRKIGKQSFKYAWVLDETGEERARGITMDVGHFKFETARKTVTLLDAPGHKDFIPNMITGAAAADVAVMVVNATNGEFETGFESGGQTREHAILVRSLGVQQLAVAVNKLDTVGWQQERFDDIRARLGAFLRSVGFREADLRYVPCSGLTGDNLTQPPRETALSGWYGGPTLLQVIDDMPAPERPVTRPLRLCVSDVFKGAQQSALSMAGRMDAGTMHLGDRVMVMPPAELATIKSMSIDEVPVQTAFAGDHVTVSLSNVDAQSQTVGVVLCDPAQPVRVATKVQARVVIFSIDLPITKGYQVVVHYQSLSEPATISRLLCQLHRSTGEVVKRRPRCLSGNSSADVVITFQRPVCVELYKDFRDYGRLMLRVAGHTVAAGLITEVKT